MPSGFRARDNGPGSIETNRGPARRATAAAKARRRSSGYGGSIGCRCGARGCAPRSRRNWIADNGGREGCLGRAAFAGGARGDARDAPIARFNVRRCGKVLRGLVIGGGVLRELGVMSRLCNGWFFSKRGWSCVREEVGECIFRGCYLIVGEILHFVN